MLRQKIMFYIGYGLKLIKVYKKRYVGLTVLLLRSTVYIQDKVRHETG
jgi:hypothetical protein